MKVIVPALGYTLFILIGWGVAKIDPHEGRNDEPSQSNQTTRSPELHGDEILADYLLEIAQQEDQPLLHPHRIFIQDLKKLNAELPPTENPRQTFLDLLESNGPRFAQFIGELDSEVPEEVREEYLIFITRLEQWFSSDPLSCSRELAAIKDTPPLPQLLGYYRENTIAKRFEKDGLRASMPWLIEYQKADALPKDFIIRNLSATGNLDDLLWLQKTYPNDFNGPTLISNLARKWPLEKKDDLLLALPVDDSSLSLLRNFTDRMKPDEALAWVSELAAQERYQTIFEQSNRHHLASSLASKTDSAEDYQTVLQLFGIKGKRANQLINQSISSILESSFSQDKEDLSYLFRHGELSAREIRDQILADNPQLLVKEEEALNQIYRNLAEEDPVAALEIFDDPSPENDEWHRANAARFAFYDVNPDEFYALVEPIDLSRNPQVTEDVRRSWETKTRSGLESFGGDYLDWVVELPVGQHREWALQSIVKFAGESQPEVAQQAQTLLNDAP